MSHSPSGSSSGDMTRIDRPTASDSTMERQNTACCSWRSPRPKAWATRPVVEARRKFRLEKRRSNSAAPIARPARAAASPVRPATAVSVSPRIGVVRNPMVIGIAIDSTSRCVTGNAPLSLAGKARLSMPHRSFKGLKPAAGIASVGKHHGPIWTVCGGVIGNGDTELGVIPKHVLEVLG